MPGLVAGLGNLFLWAGRSMQPPSPLPPFFRSSGSVRPAARIQLHVVAAGGGQDEVSPSVLFLSSCHVAALRLAYRPGFDGVACRTPFLLGRARSSKTEVDLLQLPSPLIRDELGVDSPQKYLDLPPGIFIKIPGTLEI